MQHRYAGDVGDYSKFWLMHALFARRRVALNWYLYPDESHNNDGRYTTYRTPYAPEMAQKLMEVANGPERNICALERAVAPYFEDLLFFRPSIEPTEPIKRPIHRERWYQTSCRLFAKRRREVLFVDPDNGVAVPSVRSKGQKRAGKYIFEDEIERYVSLSGLQTLVIYQHWRRQKGFAERLLQSFEQTYGRRRYLYAVRFKILSPRLYLILSRTPLRRELHDLIRRGDGAWEPVV